VFLLGHWKDYEELEDSLSMPELTATLKAMYKVENRKNKFAALLQGANIDDEETTNTDNSTDKPSTFQEIQARAVGKLTGDVSASKAVEYGFTPDMGIEYSFVGDID
jgi:hypothetical protein